MASCGIGRAESSKFLGTWMSWPLWRCNIGCFWKWKFIDVLWSCLTLSHTWKETRRKLKLAVLGWPRFEFYNAVCNVVDFDMYTRQLYANSTCCWASFGVRPGQQYGLRSSDVSVSARECTDNVTLLCCDIVWRRYVISVDQQLQIRGKNWWFGHLILCHCRDRRRWFDAVERPR